MADEDDAYQTAKRRVEARIGFLIHLAVYVVINVVFLPVVGWDWLWVTVFWGLGLAFQAVATFGGTSRAATGWKDRAIAKEMTRHEGGPPPTQPMPPAAPPAA